VTTAIALTPVGTYHVRHAGPTAQQAAIDIAVLLDLGIGLIDISLHDRHADTVTLQAHTREATCHGR
jgi:hypothetical protein